MLETGKKVKAVLFKSEERFVAFRKKLQEYNIACTILDFEDPSWLDFDFSDTDLTIHYPSFKYSSNHPLALHEVYDNLSFLHEAYPHLKMYPDPGIIKYYNDKYRQYLFLKKNHYPIADTIPLLSDQAVDLAARQLGFPMVVKNRYGAGGGTVFLASNRDELLTYYRMSRMNFVHFGAARYFFGMLRKRINYYWLLKAKKACYPFFSPPMLAQKFVKIDRDLKTVVGGVRVVEAHWRLQADEKMWKMNIDGGGTGVWSHVPQEALDLSVRLAKALKASWLNIDLIQSSEQFLVSEFSPVWHHYEYKEKPSFVYKDDYNLEVPLEISLDLERIIVESLLNAVAEEKG